MIRLKFKRKLLEYDSAQIVSLEQLQEKIWEDTQIRPEKQKIVLKGEQVEDEASFPKLLSQQGVLFGTTDEEEEQFKQSVDAAQKIRVKDDLTVVKQDLNTVAKPRNKRLPEYRFESIKVLEQFEDSDKAYEILQGLAEHSGFQAILARHKWKVGTLSEMMPEGLVGVSEVCVLGLNKNKGQEISLRIRTDDLKGFRKILSIETVLCHELSHMVWSEHDSNFYQLMRVIEREKVELDWRQSKGHTLGTGQGPSRRLLPTVPKKEKEPNKPSVEIVEIHEETPTSLRKNKKDNVEEEEEEDDVRPEAMEVETNAEEVKRKADKIEPRPKPKPKHKSKPVEEHETKQTEGASKETATERQLLGGIDPSTLPTPSEEQRREVLSAIESVIARNEDGAARNALETVLKLTRNVLKHPDNEKYRRVAMSNKTFHTKVLKALSGRRLMLAAGWVVNESSNEMLLFNSQESLGLLFCAMEQIENCLAFAFVQS